MSDEIKKMLDEKFAEQQAAYKKHDEVIATIQSQQKEIGANAVEAVKAEVKKIEGVEKSIQELKKEITELAQKGLPISKVEAEKTIGQKAFELAKGYKAGAMSLGEYPLQRKAIITTTALSSGNLVRAERDPELYRIDAPLTIMDIVRSVSTDAPAVEIVRRDALTRVAAMQATEGVTDAPQGTFTTTLVTIPMRTIFAEFTASVQALADAAQLQDIIDYELNYEGNLKLEQQVLLGDNTGQNMNGINTQASAYVAATPAETTNLDRLLRALTQVKTGSYLNPTAIVLNPVDWEKIIRGSKDTTGRYLLANPFEAAGSRVWGRPVIECYSLTAGNFLTGSFDAACKYYERQMIEISVNEQHGTNATKGLVTFVMMMRGAIAVTKPTGFVKGALL